MLPTLSKTNGPYRSGRSLVFPDLGGCFGRPGGAVSRALSAGLTPVCWRAVAKFGDLIVAWSASDTGLALPMTGRVSPGYRGRGDRDDRPQRHSPMPCGAIRLSVVPPHGPGIAGARSDFRGRPRRLPLPRAGTVLFRLASCSGRAFNSLISAR